MSEKEVLEQLYDLINDRRTFITDNSEDNEVFRRDIVALETIIDSYKNNKICLSGYRESILRRPDNNLGLVEDNLIQNQKLKQENEQLKEQLKQRDEVLDETINKIETLRMEKWSIMGTDIMELLDTLSKYKGDNNE